MMLEKVVNIIDNDKQFKGRNNVREMALNGTDVSYIKDQLNGPDALEFAKLIHDNFYQVNDVVNTRLPELIESQANNVSEDELHLLRQWLKMLTTFDDDMYLRKDSLVNWSDSISSAPDDIYYLRHLLTK